MGGVARRLELEGGVFDIEVPGQARLQGVEQLGCVVVAEARIIDDDVRGQGGQVRGEGPDVQVVHVLDMLVLQQMGPDVIEVHAFRGGFQ